MTRWAALKSFLVGMPGVVMVLLMLVVPSLVILGLSLVPSTVWDRLDGPGSEARGATAPVVESPRTPAVGTVPRLPEAVVEEMQLDCHPQEVASAIAEARIYRESMAGRTATGQSALSPMTYRMLHGVAAGALEAYITRCLRFWEGGP